MNEAFTLQDENACKLVPRTALSAGSLDGHGCPQYNHFQRRFSL